MKKDIILLTIDIGLFIISVFFLLYCINTQDRRLLSAIISVLGTLAIVIRMIVHIKKSKE